MKRSLQIDANIMEWIGGAHTRFDANIVVVHVLVAGLLHVLVVLTWTWNIFSNALVDFWLLRLLDDVHAHLRLPVALAWR
jgi:hypothetical protein